MEELAKRLVSNNKKSGNFGALIDVFCSRQSELVQSVESDRLGLFTNDVTQVGCLGLFDIRHIK